MLRRHWLLSLCALAVAAGASLARAQSDAEPPTEPPKNATIECITHPAGAAIFVGHPEQRRGYFKGITPATITIYSAAGLARPYRITFVKHGYDEWVQEFRIARGEHKAIEATLQLSCKLAYVRGDRLIVQGYDGSNPHVVAQLDETFLADSLVWSNDGRKLAFAMRGDILVVSSDGGPVRQITDIRTMAERAGASEQWFCDSPAWWPGDRRIAFRVVGGRKKLLLCTVPAEGGQVLYHFENIVALGRFHPERPVLAAEDVNSTLLINMAEDRPPRRIKQATDPQWSPDGSRLAYVLGGRIFVADNQGNTPQALTEPDLGAALSPRWSPDGRRMCFLVARGEADETVYEVWLADVEGDTSPRRVAPPPKARGFREYVDLLGFAPDGQRIAYLLGPPGQAELHLVALDGSAEQTLLEGITTAAWSGALPLAQTGSTELFQALLRKAVDDHSLEALLEYSAEEIAEVRAGEVVHRATGKERRALLGAALDGLQSVPLELFVVRMVQRDGGEFDAVAQGASEALAEEAPRLHLAFTSDGWRIAGVELPQAK